MMMLSDRERQTLLAALRCWSNELGFHSLDELHAHYPDLGPAPLSSEEVDALLARVAVIEVADVLSELVNASQVLESAVGRILRALRRLQPRAE